MSVPRWQAEQGATVRLRAQFKQNQTTLYDPLEITQVEILDSTSTVIDTLVVGIMNEAVGIWYLDWPIPAALAPGLYHDRWTYRPYAGYDLRTGTNGFAVFAAGAFGTGDAYLTASQLRSIGYIDSGSPLADAQLDFLARLATAFVERACGRKFRPWTDTIDVDGTGRDHLILPPTHPVRSLTSITNLDTGSAFDVTKLRWRGSRIFYYQWRGFRQRRELEQDLHLGCVNGAVFPAGLKNIRVEGYFGTYATVPELIQHAVGLMVKAAGADDTVTAPWILNYSQETVDGQSVVYRDIAPGAAVKMLTGIDEVDVILNEFQNRGGRVVSLSR